MFSTVFQRRCQACGEMKTVAPAQMNPPSYFCDSCLESNRPMNESCYVPISCDHEYVNVGFTSLKLVCKKCNADKP